MNMNMKARNGSTAAVIGLALLVAGAACSDGPAPAASEAGRAGAAPRSMVTTTITVPPALRTGPFAQERHLQVPEGFAIALVARVSGARSLAMAPWGDVLVTQPREGRIVALQTTDDGTAAAQRTLIEGLQCPYGMTFHDGYLYVAQSTKVERFASNDARMMGPAELIVSELPQSGCGAHHYRPLAIDPDGNLYVAFGSSCNVCIEQDPRRGTVWRYTPDGQGTEYARGLRNVVDLAFHPETGQVWVATNERDQVSDDIPPEPVGPIVEGADYGWPSCYWDRSRWVVDARVPARNPQCEGLTAYNGIQAHSAPLGITFGTAGQFPAEYQGSAFVGLHGSWNRSEGTGFKVIRIPIVDGELQPAEDFVSGWLTGPRGPSDAWGRPVDVQAAPDGSVFISDDAAGAVYRVTFSGGD